jgi:hypothetical protein
MAITFFNGFYAAWANADGTLNTSSEFQLIPSPVRVEYPPAAAGTIIETSDGAAIQQQPNNDSRIRSWIWENYQYNPIGGGVTPSTDFSYSFWMPKLEGLRSRYRREAGQSPYVYLTESVTGLFQRESWFGSTTTGAASTVTIVDTAAPSLSFASISPGPWNIMFPDSGQQGTVIDVMQSGGTTTYTLAAGGPTVAIATGEHYVLQAWQQTWFRCRVTEVSRVPTARGGGVRMDQTKLQFVIDDPNWNYLG